MIATDSDFLDQENISDSSMRLFRDYIDTPEKALQREVNIKKVRADLSANDTETTDMTGLYKRALRQDMQKNIEKYEINQSRYTGIPVETDYGLPVNRSTKAYLDVSGGSEFFNDLGLFRKSGDMHPLLFLLLLLVCVLLSIRIGKELGISVEFNSSKTVR